MYKKGENKNKDYVQGICTIYKFTVSTILTNRRLYTRGASIEDGMDTVDHHHHHYVCLC